MREKLIGVECHSFRDSEFYRVMYGEIYKLDYVDLSNYRPKIVVNNPSAFADLERDYVFLEGRNEKMIPFTDDEAAEIKALVNEKFEEVLINARKGKFSYDHDPK